MSKEIKEQIDKCYQKLAKNFDPITFTLRPEIESIWQEIEKLQSQCKHQYVNGVCKFCNREEK